MIPFSFQKGNKPAGCEDSPPVSGQNFSIVCDGLGGAGATKHTIKIEDGSTVVRTSAFLGARIVSGCVSTYFADKTAELSDDMKSKGKQAVVESFLSELKNRINSTFDTKRKEWDITPSQKRALKDFPTTLASCIYMPHDAGVTALAVWAGDSRVYALTPSKGLQLISMDDAQNAETEMNSVSEMTNCISAGNPYRLNYAFYELTEPGIIFCCSDGCFDYLQSPLHFEWLLLHTILERVPDSDASDLGAAFAESVRDSIYVTIGDDTTMVGMINGIQTSQEMKSLFQARMDGFEKLAIQMNDALKALKKVQSERDSAQKTCRLLEEKINYSLRDEVCLALMPGNESSFLRSRLSSLPCYNDFTQKRKKIEDDISREEAAELGNAREIAYQLRSKCRDMLICDRLKLQQQSEDQDAAGGWEPFLMLPQKIRGAARSSEVGEAYLNPQSARQTLLTCVEMLRHPSYRDVAAFRVLSDEDLPTRIQSQIEMIQDLVETIGNPEYLFHELWSQAFFSTEFYAKKRFLCDRSPEFDFQFEQAIVNPRSCSFASRLSVKKIEEYQNMVAGFQAIEEKYKKEKQRRIELLPKEFWLENKDAVLDWLISENEGTLQALFANTSIPLNKLLDYINAKKTLLNICQKIESAQAEVDTIWNQYRYDYQLYCKIEEKGAC